MEITPNKPITEETLHIVKDSFEEAKGIKVFSLYVEDGIIYGIYVLPLQQSLSFNTEPLLNMMTDIDGHRIIMEELGQILLMAYNMGIILYYMKLIHSSDIKISSKLFDKLLNICIDNPPFQRIDANLIDWFGITKDVLRRRTDTFVDVCEKYNQLDSLDVDTDISVDTHDDAYILAQFNEAIRQLQQKQHKKVTELTINEINNIYIDIQVDLYMTENKENTTKI